LLEPRIWKDQIFDNPKQTITSMQEEVKVHSGGVVVELVHEKDNPQESQSLESVNNVPGGYSLGTN